MNEIYRIPEVSEPERSETSINLKCYTFNTPEEALGVYSSLGPNLQLQMAQVYREAFGGPPWFERFICSACESFSATDNCCPQCQSRNLTEAYPDQELVQNYFPKMLTEFTPGMLAIALTQDELVGFTTGGFTTLDQLITLKYSANNTILQSIINQTNLQPDQKIFYDNETCIRLNQQRQGTGRKLSQSRISLEITLNADLITGRTINEPWLGLKRKQLTDLDYTFISFLPTGDNYQVDGKPRYFYVARKQ